jgi:hypothetical protein
LRFYQWKTNKRVIAAVYEENMDFACDADSTEYEAWAVTDFGVERIYVAKWKLEALCQPIMEEDIAQYCPEMLETLRIARPDDVRLAKISPHFVCEHGEGCTACSQGWLWRESQQRPSALLLPGERSTPL